MAWAKAIHFFAMTALAACGGSVAPLEPTDAGTDSPIVHRPDGAAEAGADVTPVQEAATEAEAGPTFPLGFDVSMGTGAFEAEDQIAVAPDGTICIVWTALPNGPPYVVMGYAFSTDGGASFTAPQLLALPNGLMPSDPAITTDAQGNFYASTLGLHLSGQNLDYDRVFLAIAKKGSTTFGPPVEASDPMVTQFYDHPKVHVTQSGTIAIAFMQSASIMAQQTSGVAATSADGVTWTRSTIVGPPDIQFANLFWLCDAPGALYVTYLEATQSGYGIALRKSIDEGHTWEPASSYANTQNELPAGADPECVATGQDVWVGYGTTPSPSASDTALDPAYALEVAHSGDGGHSFDAARTQALDASASKQALLPILVREDTGALDMVYVAGDGDGDKMGSVRFTQAAMGGGFGASTLVDEPLLFTVSRTSHQWLGDYFGAVAHGGSLYVAYPLNDTGETHIFFRKLPLAQ